MSEDYSGAITTAKNALRLMEESAAMGNFAMALVYCGAATGACLVMRDSLTELQDRQNAQRAT